MSDINKPPSTKKLIEPINNVQNEQIFGTGVLTGQQEMRNDWEIVLCCCCSCGSGGSSQIEKNAI